MTPDITSDTIFAGMGSFLERVLSSGTNVIQGQVNRAPEPADENFAVMWEIRATRLATNIETPDDVVFVGSISGTTLTISDAFSVSGTPVTEAVEGEPYAGFTVSAEGGLPPYTYSVVSGQLPDGITLNASTGEVSGTPTEVGQFRDIVIQAKDSLTIPLFGTLSVGRQIFGEGVASETVVTATTGDPNVFTVSPSQSVSARVLSAGEIARMQKTEVTLQIDVHGPESANNAQVLSTLFRSEYATEFFSELGTGISPLHADDPRQIPFYNGEQQVETRWIVETHFQIDPTVATPQQFMSDAEITPISVNATYPA